MDNSEPLIDLSETDPIRQTLAILVLDLLNPSDEQELKEKLRSHFITILSRQEDRDKLNKRLAMLGNAYHAALIEASLYGMTGSIDTSVFED